MTQKKALLPASVLGMLFIASASAHAAGYASSATDIKVSANTSKENTDDRETLDATLLTTQFKSRGRKDLYSVNLSAECEIRRFSVGPVQGQDNYSELVTIARVWAEIDGQIVPVSSEESPQDAGSIRLCNQLEWDEASRGNRDDLTMTSGFTWVATNLPKGNHQLEIKTSLGAYARSGAEAGNGTSIRVGKRTVTVNQLR